MKKAHLGLDVGGTASRWVACDEAGNVLAQGKVGGATGHLFNPTEKQRLREALTGVARAVAEAGLTQVSLTAGLTGYGSAVADEARTLVGETLAMPAEAVLLTDDIVLAYLASFAPGEGHLVSAGTGSIGVHIDAQGAITRVGGRGILIDDAGSGSWIALQALDKMYRVLDHSGSFAAVEVLAQQVFAQLGGTEWHDARQFVYAGDRGRIGTLAVAVARAAKEGDETALTILRRAGEELADLAAALLTRAGEKPIRFVGGVLRLHPVILAEIKQRLAGRDVRSAEVDAALAAARLQTGEHEAWRAILGERPSLS